MKLPYSPLLFTIILLFSASETSFGHKRNEPAVHLEFNPLSAYEDIPSNEVTRVMQDKRGYIWIATNSGLCRYDGYRIRTYKDNLFSPALLTDNSVKCLTDDHKQQLWIGTRKGLNKLNLKTGNVTKINNPRLNDQEIAALHVDKYNNVWVATNNYLYYFNGNQDTVLIHCNSISGGESVVGVKSFLTDSKGRMWLGTWNNGLFRYEYDSNCFIAYPAINQRNSVHVLFEDSRNTIWIGSWTEGLYKMTGMDSPETVSWQHYIHDAAHPNSLSDNIVYSIEEDLTNNTLWIGTRNGLSILELDGNKNSFVNYLPENTNLRLPYNELNSIVRDRSGIMWLGMLGGGVYSADMKPGPFRQGNIDAIKHLIYSNSVRSLFVDKDEVLWMGIGSHGLAMQEKGKDPVYLLQHPDFKDHKAFHTINAIIQRKNKHELWFATWGNGIYIYDKSKPGGEKIQQLIHDNTSWLPVSNTIYTLYEDKDENVWIGFSGGIAIYTKDGQPLFLDNLLKDEKNFANVRFNAIMQSSAGEIWLGGDIGIYRISGRSFTKGEIECKTYDVQTGNLSYDNIQCIYEDSRGNLWAASEGGGLLLYDKRLDSFVSVNSRYGILADAVLNVLEDNIGNIWLSSNRGLMRLRVSDDAEKAVSCTYTTADGLSSNTFLRNSAVKMHDGELLFGSHNGYDRFYPDKLEDSEIVPEVVITDILVFNKTLGEYEQDIREQMTSAAPDYADRLTLKYNQNHFRLEFSALSYKNPSKNKYAYKLDGYDTEWQYVGASNRMANYNNLKSGIYTFYLKGSNENGLWNEKEKALQIEILPPPWRTAKAYVLYGLIFLLLIWLLYRIIRNRIRLKHNLQLKELEQAKTEEINHAKLQFFTNITHEFLTPLTILSASLDELKIQSPQNDEYYQVMSTNINRLIRLLQQILEFRKAESGNLKLKVSEGDIKDFVRKAIDAFRPLMKKKSMDIVFESEPDGIRGYFDPDKLDKILYNLFSNASKYNKEGSRIHVTVTEAKLRDRISISVRDNGEGLSEEEQKGLFMRFYEGDYRRHNTIGTGIGLSLVKDLVILHQGVIRVNSNKGEGTEFIVDLPINRDAYSIEQIDESIRFDTDINSPVELKNPSCYDENKVDAKKQYTLLLVEDNEDLLALMVRLLEREYNVLTANEGKQAIDLISANEVDLVLSDIMMPGMDGVELCRYIKGEFDYCHIPVLLLTAKNKEEDRIEAYESGADGFLNKPFNASLLHARIKNLLTMRDRVARDFKRQLVFEVQDLNYTSMDEEFIERAITIVQNHLDDSAFDQQQFMNEMGTSKSTLYKKLKSLTGLNTSAFIRNIRLKAACQILEEKHSIRISELAYAVGFNDPKYFSACFKREFGMLPKEYQEKLYPEVGKDEL